jgi:fructosamine-3-kinase
VTRHPAVARRVEQLLGRAVVATAPVAGGDVSTATRLRLTDGTSVLVKTQPGAPPGVFEAEARGLRWLAEAQDAGGVSVVEPLAVAADCLVLPWVETTRPGPEAADDLGRRLAATHAAGAPAYGAEHDGWIARLALPGGGTDDGAAFLAERRLLPFARQARDRGALDARGLAAVEAVAARLPDLLPDEPPARLHGDLWSGNVLWGLDGAVLVDPAAYGGHRETDLAMLALFGLPHLDRVLAAYDEAVPLVDGWRDRVGLFQLFPLLVHACLFGGGYGARAGAVAAALA